METSTNLKTAFQEWRTSPFDPATIPTILLADDKTPDKQRINLNGTVVDKDLHRFIGELLSRQSGPLRIISHDICPSLSMFLDELDRLLKITVEGEGFSEINLKKTITTTVVHGKDLLARVDLQSKIDPKNKILENDALKQVLDFVRSITERLMENCMPHLDETQREILRSLWFSV